MNTNNNKAQHNLPIDGEDPNVHLQKAKNAYEKLVKEGRLHEYEKWVEATNKQRELEKAYKEHSFTNIYVCTVCKQIGPKGETCERCESGLGAVYGGPPLTNIEIVDCLEWMDEQGYRK